MNTFCFNETFQKTEIGYRFKSKLLKKKILSILLDDDGYLVIKHFPKANENLSLCQKELKAFSFVFGVPVSQNEANEFICKVQSSKTNETEARGYEISKPLPFHSDSCDFLLLLGVNPPEDGGKTLLLSSQKVYNELQERHSLVLQVLTKPFPFVNYGTKGGGKQAAAWYSLPIFSQITKDQHLMWYAKFYIMSTQKIENCPKLNEEQIHAINVLDEVVKSSNHIESVNLQRGDLLIANSHRSLHAREGFPSTSKRLLLRMWLSTNFFDLPKYYKPLFGNVKKGQYRGGSWSESLNLDLIPSIQDEARMFIANRLLRKA